MRTGGPRRSWRRVGLVGLVLLLLTALAIRTAAVERWGKTKPERALALWPGHPVPRVAAALTAIGAAAAKGRVPPPEVLSEVQATASRDPLSATVFLVEGAKAASLGDVALAEFLLQEARLREPRNTAVRFLLADLYLRGGRVEQGLDEVSALARLVPGGLSPLAPALAAYARQPGAEGKLRKIFRADPAMRDGVLSNLAADPDNAELVVRLAGGTQPSQGASDWQEQLVQRLVDRGDFAPAYRLWSRFNTTPARDELLLFNPGFQPRAAPPPFNWSFSSGRAGLAEPAGNGGLQLIHYGREAAVLASQTLVLAPGRYRLQAEASGAIRGESTIGWTVTCLPAKQVVARHALNKNMIDLRFAVPVSGCAAQRLEIVGEPAEIPATIDVVVGKLRLQRDGRP